MSSSGVWLHWRRAPALRREKLKRLEAAEHQQRGPDEPLLIMVKFVDVDNGIPEVNRYFCAATGDEWRWQPGEPIAKFELRVESEAAELGRQRGRPLLIVAQ